LLRNAVQIAIAAQVEIVVDSCRRRVEPTSSGTTLVIRHGKDSRVAFEEIQDASFKSGDGT
jgi:hypothetical protein